MTDAGTRIMPSVRMTTPSPVRFFDPVVATTRVMPVATVVAAPGGVTASIAVEYGVPGSVASVVKEVSFATIFKGVLPFIATDLIRLVILIAFPILALWLPSHM